MVDAKVGIRIGIYVCGEGFFLTHMQTNHHFLVTELIFKTSTKVEHKC